jgi:predicted alpha/beta-fold hydrolase
MLTCYLIKDEEVPKLSGAIVYCGCFDIFENKKFFTTNGMGIYNKLMGFGYFMQLTENMKYMKNFLPNHKYELIKKTASTYKFDLLAMTEEIFPLMFGFKDINEYYEYSRAKGNLDKIKVPTYFFNAEDDPSLDPKIYPKGEFETGNDKIILGLT